MTPLSINGPSALAIVHNMFTVAASMDHQNATVLSTGPPPWDLHSTFTIGTAAWCKKEGNSGAALYAGFADHGSTVFTQQPSRSDLLDNSGRATIALRIWRHMARMNDHMIDASARPHDDAEAARYAPY